MTFTLEIDSPLVKTYMAHSALLVIKLLVMSTLTALSWVHQALFTDPDAVRRMYLTELKATAPFWIIGALFVTTRPTVDQGTVLFRVYTICRFIYVICYMIKPMGVAMREMALILSYFIPLYMAICVVICYRDAL